MAQYAVRMYKIRTGEIHAVFKPRLDDDNEHERRGPHDEGRCGKCKALGRNCMDK